LFSKFDYIRHLSRQIILETQHRFQKKKESLKSFVAFLKVCLFLFPDYENYRKLLINLKQIEILSKMIFNFVRIIIKNAKIKKRQPAHQKDTLAVERKIH
jgi:hypothetical protein